MGFFKSQCKICGSRHRVAVDRLLAEGVGLREVAARFNFSPSSVGRHSLRHVANDGSGDEADIATKRLVESAERTLHRAQRKGDERTVMDALRLLATLRQRNRIRSASPERAEGNPKKQNDLVEQLRSIYHLRGEHWDKRIVQQEKGLPESTNEKLIEQLRGYVERCGDTDAVSAALCTRLASRVLRVPLHKETEVEVSRLEAAAESDNGMENLVEKTDESDADEGASDASDERHKDSPDADEPK
jgi:hypothetical protein